MSTTLELVNQTLRRAGQQEITTLTGAETPAIQALACLNHIYFEMLQLLKINRQLKTATLTTQAGVDSYALASDACADSLLEDSFVEVASGAKLTEVDYAYSLQAGPVANGRPLRFWRQENRIFLFPTPDASYSFQYRYLISPTRLTGDAQVVALPTECESVLVQGALSLLEKFLGEADYQESYVLYRNGLAQLRARSPLKPAYRIRGFYRGASR